MVSQSCLTLLQPCGAMDCDLLGSSVHGISQARRILEWITISSSKGSSQPRNRTRVSLCLLHWQVGALPLAPPGKPQVNFMACKLKSQLKLLEKTALSLGIVTCSPYVFGHVSLSILIYKMGMGTL